MREIDKHYKMRAERIVRDMYDSRIFSDDLSKETMDATVDYFALCLQQVADSTATMTKLTMDIKRRP